MEQKVLNERYRLVELIGTGGMATVYRGHDQLLDRPVAIKTLREPYAGDETFRREVLAEARAAAKLDHANIARVYDVGVDHGEPYIVMELVEGQDLKTLIHHEAPLDVERALRIAEGIAAGVGHAHRAGVIHCDLKPQNILVTPEGEVKVADFGIARAIQWERQHAEEGRQETVWGSPHYISPEQAAGEQPVPASDVYSIGIILYEMLTGVPPFHAEDPAALVVKHLRESPEPMRALNPRIPPRLEWLVRKLLAKEPATRYRDAQQLHLSLEEYQEHGEELVPQPRLVRAPVETATPVEVAPPTQPSPPPGVLPELEEHEGDEESDGLLWVLWGVAALAVVGLIPLWFYVYQAYTAPAPIPTPLPGVQTVTPAPPAGEQVSVPNLVGLAAGDAQRLVEEYGLSLEVAAERESEQNLPGTVLDQQPRPGARVRSGTTIRVSLASGREFTLPDVIGYHIDLIQPNLERQGLIVVQEEARSEEPRGQIVEQTPPPQTVVRAGNAVTLTVSGGMEQPISLHVNLSNRVMLEEALLPRQGFQPGETIPVTLRWRALQSLDRSYTVFVHLLTPNLQTLITQDDSVPVNGLNPTDLWQPGEIVVDPHQLTLPEDLPSGTYQIRVGLYTQEGRLAVTDSGETRVQENSILVAPVQVAP